MCMIDVECLVNEYRDWLYNEIKTQFVGGHHEITVPVLDDYNDYITVYIYDDSSLQNFWINDGGDFVSKLEIYKGIEIDGYRRNQIETICEKYGVKFYNDQIRILANSVNFPLKFNMFIQCLALLYNCSEMD